MSEITTAQAAKRLEVGVSTVRLWCTQGRFPNARAETTLRGVVWLIPESDLEGFNKPKRGRIPKSSPAPEKRATGTANAGNEGSTKRKGGKK